MSMRLIATTILIVLTQLAGCALHTPGSGVSPVTTAAATPDSLIARDFVFALGQLQNWRPAQTTIELRAAARKDRFTLAIHHALESSGYGTRWVHSEASAHLFEYRLAHENAAASTVRKIYELAFGEVEMRRGYVIDDAQRVQPVTPFYLRGADADNIVLDGKIFAASGVGKQGLTSPLMPAVPTMTLPAALAPMVNVPTVTMPTAALPVNKDPVISTRTNLQKPSRMKLSDAANPLNVQVATAVEQSSTSQALATFKRPGNVFDIGGTNFNILFEQRSVVAEKVLMFANDSMRLGKRNKHQVEAMVARFNPATDVFSVIGCSMGPTQIKGGNAALALGRAGRVVEALRFAGVDNLHILDEGCWSGNGKLGALPARGVVLTLRRRD